MEIPYLRTAAVKRGAVPEVLDQLEARATAYFTGKRVSEPDLDLWLSTHVQTWELHNMSYAEFMAFPGTWRGTQGHLHHPPPTGFHTRRPVTRSLTPEELAAHNEQAAREGWSQAYKNERARALQQTPLPAEEAR